MTHLLPWQIIDLSLNELLKYPQKSAHIQQDALQPIRIAIFVDFASQHFISCLHSSLLIAGFTAEFYVPDNSDPFTDILFSTEWISFNPDIVLIGFSAQSFFEKSRTTQLSLVADTYQDQIKQILRHIRANISSPILHLNYIVPHDISCGFSGSFVNHTQTSCIYHLNRFLRSLSDDISSLFIVDLDSIASFYGKRFFISEQMWVQAKQFIHPSFLPVLTKYILDVIILTQGSQVKLVIIDLDNTSWGGVLSDDGIEGIQIGLSNPLSHAFLRFQQSIKSLKNRGILLAICSKNNLDNVLHVFDKHPDIHLSKADFVSIKANYKDKVQNIIDIKNHLDIGFDSIVFLDDSEFERNHVRSLLPSVIVPELPDDICNFLDYLYSLNLFEAFSLSAEDLSRTEMYQARSKRLELSNNLSFEDYLSSLDMSLEVCSFNDFNLPRVHQLFSRSNQFNLTTKRYSLEQLNLLSSTHYTFCGRLSDKFSDEGIITCAIANVVDDVFFIDSWIMSCRVLGRGVQNAFFQLILRKAKALRCRYIVGQYLPSSKNSLVSDLYPSLGFEIEESSTSSVLYRLNLSEYATICDVPIRLVSS